MTAPTVATICAPSPSEHIEVIDKTEARIVESRTALLNTLTAASAQTAAGGVPTFEPKSRTGDGSD